MKKLKTNIFDLIKPLAHIVLLALSTLLTINLFSQLSDRLYFQIVWIAFAIVLELIKIYLYMLSMQDFERRRLGSASFKFAIYFLLAVISFIASAGFTFVSIQEQSESAIIVNEVYDYTDDKIIKLNERYEGITFDIEEARNQIEELGDDWITRRSELREKIAGWQKYQDKIQDEIDVLYIEKKENNENTAFVALSIFDLLGEEINWKGIDVMKRLMLLLAFILEVCTVLTSGRTKEYNLVYKRMIEFVDKYIVESGGVIRTNSIEIVANDLGWRIEECREYEEALKKLTYKHIPVIEKKGKETIINYDKKDLQAIIGWKFNSN